MEEIDKIMGMLDKIGLPQFEAFMESVITLLKMHQILAGICKVCPLKGKSPPVCKKCKVLKLKVEVESNLEGLLTRS